MPSVLAMEGVDGGWGAPLSKASPQTADRHRDPGDLALGYGMVYLPRPFSSMTHLRRNEESFALLMQL